MNKHQYIKGIGITATVCLVFLGACTYGMTEEDWLKNGKIRLSLNWQDKEHPASMTYYFYKDGADLPIIRRGASSGYEGTLPAGNYEVAVCAAEEKSLLLEMGRGYANACGIARQLSALKASDMEVAQPGYLYGTGDTLAGVGGSVAVVKELYPVSLTRVLELNIKITGGGEELIEKLTGLLDGISYGIHIPAGKLLFDRTAFLSFTTQPVTAKVYRSDIRLFGVPGDEKGDYEDVDLYLTLHTTDGREITSYTAITEALNEAFEATLAVRVVLDLEIAIDEINGMTIRFAGWREGTAEV